MSDLISRQAAIDYFVINVGFHDEDGYPIEDTDELRKIWTEYFDGIPPAEPKRGKWIDGIIPNDSGGLPVIVCDQCNTFFPLQFGDGHNFCPNCGADMRGEQDEP